MCSTPRAPRPRRLAIGEHIARSTSCVESLTCFWKGQAAKTWLAPIIVIRQILPRPRDQPSEKVGLEEKEPGLLPGSAIHVCREVTGMSGPCLANLRRLGRRRRSRTLRVDDPEKLALEPDAVARDWSRP